MWLTYLCASYFFKIHVFFNFFVVFEHHYSQSVLTDYGFLFSECLFNYQKIVLARCIPGYNIDIQDSRVVSTSRQLSYKIAIFKILFRFMSNMCP